MDKKKKKKKKKKWGHSKSMSLAQCQFSPHLTIATFCEFYSNTSPVLFTKLH